MRSTIGALLLLTLIAIVPLASDAGAGQAKCCNLAASFAQNLFPGGTGDEDFFTVPGGPPNVMVLLDTSASMLNFPKALAFPAGLTASQGSCSVADYADASAARLTAGQKTYESSFSFTNGNSTSPDWVTGNCGTGSKECLFDKSKFYHYPDPPTDTGGSAGTPPWTETAGKPSTSAATACTGLSGSAQTACTDCLSSSGYYLYLDSSGGRRAAFSGSFLNAYPPKFIVARKVLKDILAIDPASPSSTDNVRFGLTRFQSGGGLLVKPVLPTCGDSIGPTATTKFVAARQDLLAALDGITFTSTTPLAESLFNVAQYFSDGSDSAGAGSQWTTWFPGTWRSAFWNGTGTSSSNPTSSFCWACQQSSVVIITDGEPYQDNSIPSSSCGSDHTTLFGCPTAASGDFRRWKGGTVDPSKKLPIDCPLCGTDLSNGSSNLLHLVAAFMRYSDMRRDPPSSGSNSSQMSGVQNVSTYTIGVNLPEGSTATFLLQKTADLGGGTFVNASTPDQLASAISNAVTDVINKATSFSVSNTNTLQASTAAQLFTARFRPLETLGWEGHLYRFNLFSEFALGCDPTKTQAQQTPIPASAGACLGKNPNIDGIVTATGLAECSEFYIVDADCDPVLEDSVTGVFKKATFVSGVLTATTTEARPYWDAGKVLSTPTATGYRSADETSGNKRKILTLLDNDSTNGDGLFDSRDTLVDFTIANVDALLPYLSLDAAWCTSLYNRLGFTVPGSWTTADFTKCAKQVIWYIRGYDVLDEDEDGCAGPGGLGASGVQKPKACTDDAACSPGTSGTCNVGKCTCSAGANGEERDLPSGHWKLGDIFHSSPQTVDPPFNEMLCDIGRGQTQCVATIHSPAALARETQTAIDVNSSNVDAYDQWRASSTAGVLNRDRRRIVLAGGNDGMLHAFDGGGPDTSQSRDAFGSYPYTAGTGEELWAFIPPDLLPKLKYALDGHQYFVDGNIMVRDIWVDANGDHKKQSDEFHTLAILSERSGGSQFLALDVTDPLVPTFRWTFPQLCSLEQNLVGQSWTDFSPRPPPIGPVKIALPNGARDALGRPFEERWIAMLNGGYDPAGVKGRGVWMVDAWRGDVLWQFTDVDFQAIYDNGTPAGMFPVVASVGMSDIGDASQATLDSDGYFDTATWGDMGGQLWVARFKEPGTLVSGKVSNWYAGRAMEELRRDDDNQVFWKLLADGSKQFRNEFYRMTSNIWEPNTATLRTFVGSGNRERLLTVGPTCGPSNFLGCAQSDCGVVKLTNTTEVGSCKIVSKFMDNNNMFQHNSVVMTGCGSTPLDCGSGVKVRIDMNLNGCPGTGNVPDVAGTMTCDSNGVCSDRVKVGKTKDLSTKTWPALTNHNRFYGVWAYSADRSFSSKATAKTFDQNRFTDVPYANVCSGTAGNRCTLVDTTQATVAASGAVTCDSGTTCSATAADGGWFYEYGRKCPTSGCASAPPWTDEKTGSGATVIGSCVDWNTIRPMGAAVGGTPCSGGGGLPENYTYLSDTISGVPSSKLCGFPTSAASTLYRAVSRRSIAPPLDPTAVVSVSATSGVKQTSLQIEPGTLQHKDLAVRSDVVQPIYWLEVPRDLHVCRHTDGSICQ